MGLVRGESAQRLIPAHAGKTVVYCLPASAVAAHPRSRGENSSEASKACVAGGSSPLTRGKLECYAEAQQGGRLIPAHAGKTGRQTAHQRYESAHPRSRGENFAELKALADKCGSSPLTRGKRLAAWCQDRAHGLIPAHAGKTRQ